MDKSPIVVLTGAFQYLHSAHRHILKLAAGYGDLIVLLNSDESILEMKGYLAQPYELREKLLMNTRLVKEIRKIECNPEDEIKRIKPDYLVCGDDHSLEEILEKGGQYANNIVRVPRLPGISSSQIYKEKIKEKEQVSAKEILRKIAKQFS